MAVNADDEEHASSVRGAWPVDIIFVFDIMLKGVLSFSKENKTSIPQSFEFKKR